MIHPMITAMIAVKKHCTCCRILRDLSKWLFSPLSQDRQQLPLPYSHVPVTFAYVINTMGTCILSCMDSTISKILSVVVPAAKALRRLSE